MSTDDLARELERELDAVRDELRRAMGSAERAERVAMELAAAVEALTDILQARGTLGPGHLRMLARIRKHVQVSVEPALALERAIPDKYQIPPTPIDCESRIHLCHARCCSARVSLSEQDLREGELAWEIDRPYYVPHGPDGYCGYQDRTTGGCTTYEHRPGQCRTYDCREDATVWIDYEARIPAPLRPGLVELRRRPRP